MCLQNRSLLLQRKTSVSTKQTLCLNKTGHLYVFDFATRILYVVISQPCSHPWRWAAWSVVLPHIIILMGWSLCLCSAWRWFFLSLTVGLFSLALSMDPVLALSSLGGSFVGLLVLVVVYLVWSSLISSLAMGAVGSSSRQNSNLKLWEKKLNTRREKTLVTAEREKNVTTQLLK